MIVEEKELTVKHKIQQFWGDLCKQWYTEVDAQLTEGVLADYLVDLEQMFVYRRHLAVVEMPLKEISGKLVLEIGSGGGAHSALFKKYGANVIAVDITRERVVSTVRKLSLIKGGDSFAVQADAESLPFPDGCCDFVYSNGVLHHSESTQACMGEVFRVLKPRGKAVIMLYARHSAEFWFNLLPRSIFSGMVFRYPEAERLGILTEGRPKYGRTRNPITRVYSKRELKVLLKDFQIDSLRKSGFTFLQIPVLGSIRKLLMRFSKSAPYKSGIIVYGSPFHAETRTEIAMGKIMGFCWNIILSKADKKGFQ